MSATIHDDHGHLGFLLGYPVYESSLATEPLVLRPGNGQIAIIVPDFRQFETELWIEQTLHKIVRESMGATLEWIYGPQARKWWVGSKSRYSQLMMRLQLEKNRDDLAKWTQAEPEPSVPTSPSESRAGDGHWIPQLVYGSTATRSAAVLSTITGS